jgi:hypothetical protein
MNKLQKVLLIPGSLVLVASLGMACGDDDTPATPTSPIMTDSTPTPAIDGGGTTPTIDGDVDDDIVARMNDLGAEIATASEEARADIQELWNEAQAKLSELATATADERDEIQDELEDLVNRIEERLDEDS